METPAGINARMLSKVQSAFLRRWLVIRKSIFGPKILCRASGTRFLLLNQPTASLRFAVG